MLPGYYALIGSLIASSGGVYYLYCTICGTVKPNRITWFFWGAFPLIAFAAQYSQGVGLIAFATLAGGLPPFLVFLASFFNPAAYWRIKSTDYFFALVAVVSLVLWFITKNSIIALTFALVADFAVALPTLLKSLHYPETEDWKAYGISTFGFGIALLSISVWSFESTAFVLYLFAINTILAILSSRKPAKKTFVCPID